MIEIERKVNKDLVHKSHDDDVLIYDARHLLPAWLPAAVVQAAGAERAAMDALDLAYRSDGERWVLRSVHARISPEALESSGLCAHLPEIQVNYEHTADEWVLKGLWVLESTQAAMSELNGVGEMLGIGQRQQVHEALKHLPGYPRQGLLYFTLFNDTSNYFFYRKHHEHVPGLMLIEAARQAMYAQYYEYSGFARGEVSISIVDLLSSFPRYTESSYQVDVLVCDFDEQLQTRARKVDKRARFFQGGELVADIRLRGEAIKMPVFKRMRNISINPSHWFRPLKGIRHEVLVRLDCGRHLSGQLELLSMSGLQVHCKETITALDTPKHGHVYLYLESDGLVMLPVHALHERGASNGCSLQLHLADLTAPLRFKWREVLKQFAYFSHHESADTPLAIEPSRLAQEPAAASSGSRMDA